MRPALRIAYLLFGSATRSMTRTELDQLGKALAEVREDVDDPDKDSLAEATDEELEEFLDKLQERVSARLS